MAKSQAGSEWLLDFKKSLGSWTEFLRFIETKESVASTAQHRNVWSNADLDISPRKDWTWTWWDYAAFWWSYGFSVGVWALGSSMISLGLTWWQAIICVFMGHLLGAIGIVFHSRSAAKYHFGFPVACRATWGMYGAYFPVIIRTMVGTIWAGLSIIEGGYFVSIILRCIIGTPFYEMHDPIPASSDITIQDLIGTLIYFIATLPLLWLRPTKVKILFSIKSVVLPPTVMGLFIFCMLQGRKSGKPSGVFTGYAKLHGAKLAWGMLSAINSCMGKTASLIVNQPDLARYARKPSSPVLSQLISLVVGNTLCATLGIFASSAIQSAWGVLVWNPWTLCQLILTERWDAGARTGITIVSLGFILSTFASTLGANVLPWGADASILLPRFINIRRGMYLCYAIALCICPWHILQSATTFLRFLGGYSVFLGPLVGIFITDYFVVRRGNIWLADLYTSNREARYWYTGGFNWRAFAAFVIAVVLPIPGFATLFGEEFPGADAWIKIYDVGWLIGCVLSSVAYFGLCKIGKFLVIEGKMGWEEIVDEQVLQQLAQNGESVVEAETGSETEYVTVEDGDTKL